MNATNKRSQSLYGAKSPNPTVDNEVKAKYISKIVLKSSELDSISYSLIKKF